MIISLTTINGAARVVLSTGMTVSIVDRGSGIFIEFDRGGHVVAAQFNSHTAAVTLISLLISNYGIALTSQDKSRILSVF